MFGSPFAVWGVLRGGDGRQRQRGGKIYSDINYPHAIGIKKDPSKGPRQGRGAGAASATGGELVGRQIEWGRALFWSMARGVPS